MNFISRFQPLIIIFSTMIGLILGIFTPLGNISVYYVEIFLMLLLFILFLSVDIKQFKRAALNIKYTSTSLIINFIITPIIAYLLGLLFFEDSIAIRIGLLMLLVTPCTDWYLVFTKLSRGNVEINLSILPLNLILQVVLLPLYLLFFFKSVVDMELTAIINGIVMVLFIPFVFAVFIRTFTKKTKELITNHGDELQLLFLCLAVIVMFASKGQSLLDNYFLLLMLFVPLLCFFITIYFMVKIIGKVIDLKRKELISLHFTTLARNSPLALAISVSAFPDEPLISLSLIIGPLLELPILSLISGRFISTKKI